MNILVLGGCGYVGTVLTSELLNEGHTVTVFDIMWFGNYLIKHSKLTVLQGDIRNIENIPMRDIDAIIHLGNVANDPCGDLDPKLTWEVNALATMQLIEKAICFNVHHFIYASSGSVYGVKDEPEVTEDLSLIPISDYNKTKMISERVLMSYMDKIPISIIRPATICGYSPRMRLDLSVNMLTIQALTNKRITVFGGTQTRPNIHIKDIISIYLHFLKMENKGIGIYNAGFENISIMDIAVMVTKYVPAEIIVTESNDPRSYRLNSNKLLQTGFKPVGSVEMAIQDMIKAFQSGKIKNEDNCYNIKTMKKLETLA